MGIIQVGHIKSAREKRFSGLIDVGDIQPSVSGDDKENQFLTRALAAFAVAELAKADDKVAADSVVDEFHDDGIDLTAHSTKRAVFRKEVPWFSTTRFLAHRRGKQDFGST